jgi:hypothetical protein
MSKILINEWDIEKPGVYPGVMDVPKCPLHKIERLFFKWIVSI